MMIRLIEPSDYGKGYLELINVFTRAPEEKSYDEFCMILDKIKSQDAEVYVIEKENRIVSSIHLLFEQKLHNNFKMVCHIEDVVSHPQYRKQGYASALLHFAVQRASEKNCYKVVLTTNADNVPFYTNNGFQEKGFELCKYL
jgi:glucosamine-phosphate N-acetyltransferase